MSDYITVEENKLKKIKYTCTYLYTIQKNYGTKIMFKLEMINEKDK